MLLVRKSSRFNLRLLTRSLVVSPGLTLLVSAGVGPDARTRPNCRQPDGSNDTPEMIISMINNGPAAAASPVRSSSPVCAAGRPAGYVLFAVSTLPGPRSPRRRVLQ
jgi:hypothetical protein